MSIAGGDFESVSSSTAGSTPETPRNRLKFLCSHGGKFLPRPADGRLKYVGGETRVVCVPRNITFRELMKKLNSMWFNGEMILKYQLIPEDLDVLVTVKSDEDIRHMIEECDEHELLSAPRLRAFLFSSNTIIIHPSPPYNTTYKPPPVYISYTTFTISSACSSPRTPPNTTATNPEVTLFHGSPSNHQNRVNCNHQHPPQPPKPPLDPHLHKGSRSQNR